MTTWLLVPAVAAVAALYASVGHAGATGYIASHTWLALQAAGLQVVGVDDFSNSAPEVLHRLHHLRQVLGQRVDRPVRAQFQGGLAVGRGNIIGVQFHPEKSQAYGINFLKRFLEWRP